VPSTLPLSRSSSGACAAASWPMSAVRETMDALATENGLTFCAGRA
jgi:hypothetical protein